MDKNQHIIFTMGIFNFFSTLFILLFLSGFINIPAYNYKHVFIAGIWVVIFFHFGAIAPDLDHEGVQKKWYFFYIRWIGKLTKHRGHFHSLFAMCVYGFLVGILMWFLGVKYIWYPIIAGMFGFYTHLLADDLMRINTIRNLLGEDDLKRELRRAIKIFGKIPFTNIYI
jgi:membrane-bound metal-dependent hydrolase YbcI (DUF457 family)